MLTPQNLADPQFRFPQRLEYIYPDHSRFILHLDLSTLLLSTLDPSRLFVFTDHVSKLGFLTAGC